MGNEDFVRLIAGLMQPDAYPGEVTSVDHIETHISHIMLAGDHAYKLKKPIDLGFLDFSTLELRRHCCEEELRLNRRLAEALYIDVVPITGTPDAPRMEGRGPALEYAVKMHRFPQEALLDRQPLSGELMVRLGELVADFHASVSTVDLARDFGTPPAVLEPMLENFRAICARAIFPETLTRLDRLESWTLQRHCDLMPWIERRRRQGMVRECHGDMHRGNIARVGDAIHIFDAIEFNPNLRWIDTASEVAFLVMDLEQAGESGNARLFLNRYLERSGDYDLLRMLDFYKVYRAMVRAKVLAIRLDQGDLDREEAMGVRRTCMRYLQLAESYTLPRHPHLLIACGLSGSGKSSIAYSLREALPFIHLRSDVERKRLFGLRENARTLSGVDSGIYFPSATDWTYDRLHQLAESILDSGYDVLIDATFLSRSRRRRFSELARRRGAGFAILALDAPLEILRQRVIRRLANGGDVSDATVSVLERQHAGRQCLSPTERSQSVLIDTSRPPPFPEVLTRVKRALEM
ncbi:bifunctional aminoglycoside phosphotransferase/ATP-binding protein [Imhoffiella purpurea]|uniref:Aminoglycoside phosphotransferase domain-containing protein n=1 Tax=Imhoffiella purpurea TaxID=1249627 RepID=W9V2T2_9GAMM|nr:bifunctional aminoglycoside phosphotransferase/ATP-binding protein [Imhoffiella purpurea]EXJ13644.1 hypothetical protein D779_3536 [Imhoffiella purpurea]